MLVREVKYDAADYDPDRHPGNIDQLTLARVPSNSRVLEIGCATGFMGAWLQQHKISTVIGVEYSPEQAAVARQRLTDVIVGNVESSEVQARIAQAAPFDVVMSTAMIGFLVDPWALLRQARYWLAPNGRLLVAYANVAHWTMRRSLLFGRWDYQDYGILDVGSLRFFTVHSFRRSLEQAGYRVNGFDAEFYDGGPRVLLRRLRLKGIEGWYVRHFANLFAIQFVYEAVPT